MPDGDRRATAAVPAGRTGPPRHELPALDEAGLEAARRADAVVAAAREVGADRWVTYLEPLADRLRDDQPHDLRQAALRARAAFGPKDSIRDVLPMDVTEPFLDAIDRLLRVLTRREVA